MTVLLQDISVQGFAIHENDLDEELSHEITEDAKVSRIRYVRYYHHGNSGS